MNRLQLSVSPTATLNKIDEFSAGHDKKVIAWRDKLIETMARGIILIIIVHTHTR